MSLIFAPGKYLTLIFIFLDIFFSISPDIVESPKISVVPFLHSLLFYCTVLLPALLVFSVGAVWISFLAVTCSSECFGVCPTSITRQFLVFELRGGSCLEGLLITTSKSTPDGLLEKPSTALLLTGVLTKHLRPTSTTPKFQPTPLTPFFLTHAIHTIFLTHSKILLTHAIHATHTKI